MQFFSSDKRLQEIFFQNHPPPPSRVKWSAPKIIILHGGRWKRLMGMVRTPPDLPPLDPSVYIFMSGAHHQSPPIRVRCDNSVVNLRGGE